MMKRIPAWKLAMYKRDMAAAAARELLLTSMTAEEREGAELMDRSNWHEREAARQAATVAAFRLEEGAKE